MKCVWLEDGELSVRSDVPEPVPAAGEALVRVRLAGICATDLELQKGYYSYKGILGHEFIGEVALAPEAPEWEGRRVVGEINASCHDCPTCRAGRSVHCPNRTVLGIVGRDGAFAEYLTLPLVNLHEVPESVSDESAVFCEPLAAALRIGEQIHLSPTTRVLLVGAGRLGQLVAKTLALYGVDLTVAIRDERKKLLIERTGAKGLYPREVEAAGLFDVVVEASGSPDGWRMARHSVRPGGTIVLKSTYAGRLEIDASALVVDEINVVGSRCGPFGPALRLLEKNILDLKELFEVSYPIDDARTAFEHASKHGALKVLLEIGG